MNQEVDPQVIARLLGDNAWKLSPATLMSKISKGDWIPAKHLVYMSTIITHALAQGNARLILSTPPRHGKSEFGSVGTPTWLLENNPKKEIILSSYGADLAEDFGRKVRDNFMNDNELTTKIRKDAIQVSRFLTEQGGGMRSVGVKGPIYGRGADVFILDDYYKNPEEAFSDATRDAIFDWFVSIAMSRLHPGGSVIIIATRWGPDDLAARLLNMPDSPWREIKLPAVAYEPGEMPYEGYVDPLGRAPGEVLWPERYNKDHMNNIKRLVGSYFWASIYQQNPLRSRSNLFKENWLTFIDKDELPHPSHLRYIRSWDLAGTADGGDWTVGTLLARDLRNRDLYIIDVKRRQLSPGGVENLIERTAEDDGKHVEVLLEQEPGSSGKAVIEHYQKTVLKGYVVNASRPTGDKFVRAQGYLAACEAGDVHVVRARWNQSFLNEHLDFPSDGNKGHDDQVDTCTQAYNHMFSVKSSAGTWGRTPGGVLLPQHMSNMEQTIAAQNRGGSLVQGCTWGR